jgi:uncharacterized protein (DUF305 family)
MHKKHYVQLAVMTVVSFVAMYILMYAMVDRFANVYSSVNQFYMAGLMSAPMVLIELVIMREMYKDSRLNLAFGAVALVALVGFFALIRQQAVVTDNQFLRSMIPHHAGAILMCEQAPIQRAEIKKLCLEIISSQKREIDQMKSLLNER